MTNKTQIEKSLIEEMGLGDLSEEKQQELTDKMLKALLKRIYVEATEKLSEEDRAFFAQMLDRDASPEEIEEFLQEKIPDFVVMVKEILAGFKEEMLKL